MCEIAIRFTHTTTNYHFNCWLDGWVLSEVAVVAHDHWAANKLAVGCQSSDF
jgi:hypothetical protein